MRVIVLFLLAFLVTSINAQAIKIGYIDVEKVITSLSQYQRDNNSLIQQFEPKKQQLLDLFRHIELLKKNLNTTDKSTDNENYQREFNNIRELELSFQDETELWQQQLNQKKYESLQKIETMINLTIEEFATSQNYDLILYQNAAFVNDELNITNQIISIIEGTSP
jgi:outer membrane protein